MMSLKINRLNRAAQELVRYAEQHGFSIVRYARHILMRREDGVSVAIPSTPSDDRGLLNKKAEIRRLSKIQK